MNAFDRKIKEVTGSYLESRSIETIQVNVGLRCNNLCAHCHLQASPERTEAMDWPTMQLILDVAHTVRPMFIDITGGAPELNPLLCRFIEALREDGQTVQVRTNLTVLLEPEMATMMRFYADAGVKLVALNATSLSAGWKQTTNGIPDLLSIARESMTKFRYSPTTKSSPICRASLTFTPPFSGYFTSKMTRRSAPNPSQPITSCRFCPECGPTSPTKAPPHDDP